jgi:hypothetical protein
MFHRKGSEMNQGPSPPAHPTLWLWPVFEPLDAPPIHFGLMRDYILDIGIEPPRIGHIIA